MKSWKTGLLWLAGGALAAGWISCYVGIVGLKEHWGVGAAMIVCFIYVLILRFREEGFAAGCRLFAVALVLAATIVAVFFSPR